jgi:rhodanese-related sulfurtransferase
MERSSSKQDMTVIAIGFGLVIATSVFFLLKGPTRNANDAMPDGTGESANTSSPLQTISVVEVRSILAKSAATIQLVDLRSADEFRLSHAAGSIVASSIQDFTTLSVPAGESILLISSGSADTDRKISDTIKAGGEKCSFIVGGLSGWQSAGGAIVTEPTLSSPIDRSKVTFIKADAWNDMFTKKEVLYRVLDIRSAEESAKSPLSGASRIPYADLEKMRSEIPYASNIALCASSAEDAFRGAVRLFDLGFFSVKALDGSCSDIIPK